VRAATSKQPGLSSCLGALALLVAAVAAPIGLMSIGSAPLQGIGLLGLACLASGLFVWAWLRDRRWRNVQPTTIHRHPAGGRAPGRYVSPVNEKTNPIGRFGQALRMFLDDPAGLGALTIDGPGTFYLRFTVDPADPNVLSGRAVAISRLEPSQRPPEDAWLGLVALGWAASERPAYREAGAGDAPREEFGAEWELPVALDDIDAVIRSTATVYGVDAALLRPRFASGRPSPDEPVSDGEPGGEAPAEWDPLGTLRRWDDHPAATFAWIAIGVVFLVAGRDRIEGFIRAIPGVLAYGALAALCFAIAIHLLNRYTRTADPFSLTGWNRLRRRTVTTYEGHVWWGIFGVIAALIGVFFVIQAVTGSSL